MLTAVSMSALMTSAAISPGPAAFPFLRVVMAFFISACVWLVAVDGQFCLRWGYFRWFFRGGAV